jgi:ribosomal protein S6--L-glutamate ligase
MNILILSRDRQIYSTCRLAEAARQRGHVVRKIGLSVCGVDILRSSRGPLVMEVNSSPGLEGIEKASGKDVAAMIIEFTEKNAKPHRTHTRGKG